MASAAITGSITKRSFGFAEYTKATETRGGDGRPLLRFMQINDTHVYVGPPHPTDHYAWANEKWRWVVETIHAKELFRCWT